MSLESSEEPQPISATTENQPCGKNWVNDMLGKSWISDWTQSCHWNRDRLFWSSSFPFLPSRLPVGSALLAGKGIFSKCLLWGEFPCSFHRLQWLTLLLQARVKVKSLQEVPSHWDNHAKAQSFSQQQNKFFCWPTAATTPQLSLSIDQNLNNNIFEVFSP